MAERFDWDGLQSFLAVARAGRLTEAARRLGVDHSTLSRRIAALERHLRTKLFDRRNRGYALTAQGERLLASAQEIESLATHALADIADASVKVAGTVRVGAPDGFGTLFLAERLGKLADAHPGLSLQLVTQPRPLSVTSREADITVTLARPTQARLIARRLTDYELGLYAAPAYLERAAALGRPADIARHRLIGYVDDLIYGPELDYLPQLAEAARAAVTCSSLVAQYQATLAGHGLCVLPHFVAGADPRLVRVLPDALVLTRSFWLVVSEDMRALARIRLVGDFIAAEVEAARSLFLPAAPYRSSASVPP